MGIPIATLHTRIRKRVDLQDTNYLGDTQLTEWCLDGYLELWDVLIAAYGQESPWKRKTLTTVAGQDYVDVASATVNVGAPGGGNSDDYADDIYHLVRVEWDGANTTSGVWEALRRGNLTADPRYKLSQPWSAGAGAKYFSRRDWRAFNLSTAAAAGSPPHPFSWRIYWDRPPNAAYNLQLWYVPVPPFVWRTNGIDPPSLVQYPDESPDYVVAYCAALAAEKQEQDASPFRAELERITARIMRFSTPLDTGGPQFAADLRRVQADLMEPDPFMDRRR